MTDYTDVFGTNTVPSTDNDYSSYALTANGTFFWPYNYSGTGYVISKHLDITCAIGVVMTMPDANEVSDGETVLIRNIGANTLTIVKSDASALTTVIAGASVMIYVTDNSTEAGTWGVVTYGTGSSSADSASLAGYGLTAIGSVLNSAFPTSTQSSSFSVISADRAKLFIYTGGVGTITLPDATTLDDDFFVLIRNSGTGTLTVDAHSTQLIDGELTLVFNPGESAIIVCNSSAWFSVGYGRSVLYQFTQLVKDVSAGGSFTLSSTEASNKLLTFIGSPASSVTIVVPTIVSIYYLNSDISTAQTITTKTLAGSGAAMNQGQRVTVFCDGVDVLDSQTAGVSVASAMDNGSAPSPALKFTSDTDTGFYNLVAGVGVSVGGTAITKTTADGLEVTQGYLKLPGAASPAQIIEGAAVWDTDDDLLTVGTGAGRKTMVDTNSAQTLTNKTLTSPVVNSPTGIVKADVGLANVDNTSDATKNSATATLTNKTVTNVILDGAITEEVYTLTGTTPVLEPDNGTIQTWTLTANSSPTDGFSTGQYMTLLVDDGTAYTITWPTMTWLSDGAPTLEIIRFTVIELWKVGATLYGVKVGV